MEYSSYNVNTPQWREITVGSHLPAELRKLAEIAHNLWWTWNDDAKKLYCDLDSELWKEAPYFTKILSTFQVFYIILTTFFELFLQLFIEFTYFVPMFDIFPRIF